MKSTSKVRTFLRSSAILAGPHNFTLIFGFKAEVGVRGVVGMVKVSIRGWGMDYVWESLYKDRSTRKCVCVCMLARINFLLIL